MDCQMLIDLVKARPALWDKKEKNHHNRYILEKNWDEIAKKMKLPSKAIRDKWKNLRDVFRKELRKILQGNSAQKYEPTWSFFKSMYFLKHQFETDSNSDKSALTEFPEQIADTDSSADEDERNESIASLSPAESNYEAFDRELAMETNSSKHITAFFPLEEQRNKRLQNEWIDIERKKIKLLENAQNRHIRDEDESFFDSLLPHIKKLTPSRKLLCRMKLQEIVYKFVYDQPRSINN